MNFHPLRRGGGLHGMNERVGLLNGLADRRRCHRAADACRFARSSLTVTDDHFCLHVVPQANLVRKKEVGFNMNAGMDRSGPSRFERWTNSTAAERYDICFKIQHNSLGVHPTIVLVAPGHPATLGNRQVHAHTFCQETKRWVVDGWQAESPCGDFFVERREVRRFLCRCTVEMIGNVHTRTHTHGFISRRIFSAPHPVSQGDLISKTKCSSTLLRVMP